MSNRQLRNVTRVFHLFVAVCMALAIYSPLRLNSTFMALVQFVVVPLAVVSGLVMWQQPLVTKLLRQGRGA